MVFHSRPFKKDITPFAKGGKVVKHIGKGAREQSTGGGMQSMTGGDPMSRMMSNYAKPAPPPEPEAAAPSSSPVPMGSRPPGAPTAMMPSSGGGEPDEDDI